MSQPAHSIRFDSAAHTLQIDGRNIPLTGIERRLVALLVSRFGTAISHADIRRLVWGEAWNGGDEALRVTVNRLRKKMETDQRKPEILVSVRGVGYRMNGNLST